MPTIRSRENKVAYDPMERGEAVLECLRTIVNLAVGKTRDEVMCLLEGCLMGVKAAGMILSFDVERWGQTYEVKFSMLDDTMLYTTMYIA